MKKRTLAEMLIFYRDNAQQVKTDWYIAHGRRVDQLGYSRMDEARLLAIEDIKKLHPEYYRNEDLLWSYIPQPEELTEGAPRDIDRAIDFCELDIRGFRMGYLKAELFQILKRLTLSKSQKVRVQELGIAYIKWPGNRRELEQLARLLIVVADSKYVLALKSLAEESELKNQRGKAHMFLYVILNSRMDLRSVVPLPDRISIY